MDFATPETKKELASLLDQQHRARLISYKRQLLPWYLRFIPWRLRFTESRLLSLEREQARNITEIAQLGADAMRSTITQPIVQALFSLMADFCKHIISVLSGSHDQNLVKPDIDLLNEAEIALRTFNQCDLGQIVSYFNSEDIFYENSMLNVIIGSLQIVLKGSDLPIRLNSRYKKYILTYKVLDHLETRRETYSEGHGWCQMGECGPDGNCYNYEYYTTEECHDVQCNPITRNETISLDQISLFGALTAILIEYVN